MEKCSCIDHLFSSINCDIRSTKTSNGIRSNITKYILSIWQTVVFIFMYESNRDFDKLWNLIIFKK